MKFESLVVALAAGCLVSCAPTPQNHVGLPNKNIPELKGSAIQVFDALCGTLDIPCGVEEDLSHPFSFHAYSAASAKDQEFDLRGYTSEKIMNALLAREPFYDWSFNQGVLTIQPRLIPSTDPLERRIHSFSVEEVPSLAAMKKALEEAGLQPETGTAVMGSQVIVPVYVPVSVNLQDVTARQALNRIVAAEGKATWRVALYKNDPGEPHVSLGLTTRRGETRYDTLFKKDAASKASPGP